MARRKVRLRRGLQRRQQQAAELGTQAEAEMERLFFRRLAHLGDVRRFVISWLSVLVLLSGVVLAQTSALEPYYTRRVPASGGTYTEGTLGSFTNANPLYASGDVDSTVARLVFAGLLQYDERNQLVGQLAKEWSVDARGITYTVKLKPGLKWHDDKPLTSADVVFTYQTIQNPDAKSPLFSSWKDIKVQAVDPVTVVFTLPNALTAFPTSLVNGIVPKHLLADVPPSQLRSAEFNTLKPVGAGPFMWHTIEVRGDTPQTREEQIALVANPNYVNGTPKIDQFVVRSFHDEGSLTDSFKRGELQAMVGLETRSDELKDQEELREFSFSLNGAVMAFFKTTSGALGDIKVRQALVKATNQPQILQGLGYEVTPVRQPLLESQVGYDKTLSQFNFNLEEANALLESAGWVRGPDGRRQKDGKPLSFRLLAQTSAAAVHTTKQLHDQWRKVGVDAQIILQSASDLQTAVTYHNYDALLYGISIGADPDVFAYWHSSQANITSSSRLNLSEYSSQTADRALEAGRTRDDTAVRATKYKPFLEAWRLDAPAVALYQPRFLYLAQGHINGLTARKLNIPTDRFSNVQNWTIRQTKASL